jgi:isopropylmalate/homocitrate/citramalate synthase
MLSDFGVEYIELTSPAASEQVSSLFVHRKRFHFFPPFFELSKSNYIGRAEKIAKQSPKAVSNVRP